MRDIVETKLTGAYKGFVYSALFSLVGLIVELVVFSLYGSIILLTDIVHWAIDTIVEFFGLLALYYAIRIGKRFPWSVMVLESQAMLLSITLALGIYIVSFASYLTTNYSQNTATTTSLVPAVATILGGVFTALTLVIQRRNYEKYKLEILKVDYTHALLDMIAAGAATIGVILVYYTQSSSLELLFVVISSMFIIHSLLEILKDIVKTITGTNIDHALSIKIYKKLINEYDNLQVEDVVARRIGSFYIVEAKIGVDPRERIGDIYRLRKKIISSIFEESSLIYHIDIKIFPLKQLARKKK